MQEHFSELHPGVLWSGDDSFYVSWPGEANPVVLPSAVVKVITVLNKPCTVAEGARCYVWLPASDDEPLRPEVLDAAVAGWVPTYVHCHLGQNRSTAIAAAWLRRNTSWSIDRALAHVVGVRTRSLATIGRGKAEISPAMRMNLHRYDEWLNARLRDVHYR